MSGSPILVWGCGVTGGMTVSSDWQAQFDAWLAPYLARLQRKEQRHGAAHYLQGLIGPGERKSVEPMAGRVAPGQGQQLHHFVAIAPWDQEPLEDALVKTADRLLGGAEAVLVIDDTALPKKGRHSVGDRKSTRLNSSHANISYAVLCLKKMSPPGKSTSADTPPCAPMLSRCSRCIGSASPERRPGLQLFLPHVFSRLTPIPRVPFYAFR